jgi:Tfp pilus assembly protein PilZ
MLKNKGLRIGDKVLLRIGIKNTNATLDLSDTVALIAGKAAAKIVIHVW